MKSKLPAYIALALGILEVCLVPASWILSVLFPDYGLRSMLGSEGVRWFLGSFTEILSGPVLVWMLLLSMAWGCAVQSGILNIVRSRCHLEYRERIARSFVVCLFLVCALLHISLAFMPHAVLLSVSGGLFPSPFSSSLIPVLCFIVCLVSVVYGIISGRFKSVEDVYGSLFVGIVTVAPLFLFYILLAQLFYSVMFVFG